MRESMNNEKGFTLLEMIVTVVFIGIMSTTILMIYSFYFSTAFQSIESSNKHSVLMDIDFSIKSELLGYEADINVSENGDELMINDILFKYSPLENTLEIHRNEDVTTYHNLFKVMEDEPIFKRDNDRVTLNITLEDRLGIHVFSNQYIIREGRYDKNYFTDNER